MYSFVAMFPNDLVLCFKERETTGDLQESVTQRIFVDLCPPSALWGLGLGFLWGLLQSPCHPTGRPPRTAQRWTSQVCGGLQPLTVGGPSVQNHDSSSWHRCWDSPRLTCLIYHQKMGPDGWFGFSCFFQVAIKSKEVLVLLVPFSYN